MRPSKSCYRAGRTYGKLAQVVLLDGSEIERDPERPAVFLKIAVGFERLEMRPKLLGGDRNDI